MLLEDRASSPCFDAGDLSKDFGLDITVSDGGLVTSANNQRQYQAECSRIYQQFFLNMSDYINEEANLRKSLNALHSQRRLSPKRSAPLRRHEAPRTPEAYDEDAFTAAQLEDFRNILNHESSRSRLSHAIGFAAVDGGHTPATAGGDSTAPKLNRTVSSIVNQPAVTHMFPALKERPLSVKASQLRRDSKCESSVDGGTHSEKKGISSAKSILGLDQEYDGVMEPNAELSNNRRIRMNQRAFTKLMTGQVKVKLLNKTGDFVLTPVSTGSAVLSPEETEKQLMDNREKVAVVKQKTTFQSPTLSSDLKISNLVAIQKALKGQSAKRVTVGEVMKSARDRRARLFRVQMSGNRFDEFDKKEEDIGFVHEVKAATDLRGDEEDARPPSCLRFSPHLNMLRQTEQRPESRLRSPTPIPLHILDPKAAETKVQQMHSYAHSRANTPGILKQASQTSTVDCSALTVHRDCSDFELRYSQAVDQFRPKDRQALKKQLSVVDLGFDEYDGTNANINNYNKWKGNKSHPTSAAISSSSLRPKSGVEFDFANLDDGGEENLHPGPRPFSRSKSKRAMLSKSAHVHHADRVQRMNKRPGMHSEGNTRSNTPYRAQSPSIPDPPVKKISNMRDTACIVKRFVQFLCYAIFSTHI